MYTVEMLQTKKSAYWQKHWDSAFLPAALSNTEALFFLHWLLYDVGAQYNRLCNHLALGGQNSSNTVQQINE